MLQAKLEMEPSANGPMACMRAVVHTHIQILSKAKIFRKGHTDFIFKPK